MLYLTVLLTLVGVTAGILDEELDAKFLTMPHMDFIDHFNKQNYSWKMKQYAPNVIININNNYNITNVISSMNDLPIKYHDPKSIGELPKNFDARDKWCHCKTIREIYSQFTCESCWAHGVANTASDRICIKHGKQIRLSEQDLECSHPHKTICHTGIPADGFVFWKKYGLVSRECKPYEPLDINRNECVRFCRNSPSLKTYLGDKYYAKEVYRILNDSYQIKAELVTNGPVQATMVLYSDFMNGNVNFGYSSGIYEHKTGVLIMNHSVRVIGYGVENGIDYWLVANSWGSEWGEKGLFRIKAFQEDIKFEESISAGIPY